jgi:two-component system response regulator
MKLRNSNRDNVLKSYEIQPSHLIDGAQALDFIFAKGEFEDRNIENTPKVIFLDLKMPKIGGLEVLKILKSDERTKLIPVVMMT